MLAELDDFLGMAGWAKPATATGKRQKIFVMAVGTTDPGKTFRQVTTLEVTPNHIRDHLPIKAIENGDFLLPTVYRSWQWIV